MHSLLLLGTRHGSGPICCIELVIGKGKDASGFWGKHKLLGWPTLMMMRQGMDLTNEIFSKKIVNAYIKFVILYIRQAPTLYWVQLYSIAK